MRRDDRSYLLDMLVAAHDAVAFAKGLSYDEFATDRRRRLPNAVHESRRSPLSLVRESLALQRGPGRLPFREYVQLGVYRPSLDDTERRRFLSESLHWPIVNRVNDFTWQAATEDKWLCARVLERFDIPTVPILAVVDLSGRPWPGTRVLEDAGGVRDFLHEHLPRSALFGKVNRGLASHGAFLVTSADARSSCLDRRFDVARRPGFSTSRFGECGVHRQGAAVSSDSRVSSESRAVLRYRRSPHAPRPAGR